MPISIERDRFPNIIEIWGNGVNIIVAHTANGRCYKITADRNIRSGSTPKYSAHYEERRTLEIDGNRVDIWVRASLPWQNGDNIEECLILALRWVDEQG